MSEFNKDSYFYKIPIDSDTLVRESEGCLLLFQLFCVTIYIFGQWDANLNNIFKAHVFYFFYFEKQPHTFPH